MSLRRGQKTPESGWRFLRTHDRLKGVVLAQMAERKLSPTKLAVVMGITKPCVYGWLRGVNSPSLTDYQLIKICDYLGIEVDLEIKVNG